ncbi:transcription factor Opi1-domain-containing protein [Butyriboletus roseoflavus]|nr:transcription factor Opi1-domain-containing protein [Butyriboletus roseoflavus]
MPSPSPSASSASSSSNSLDDQDESVRIAVCALGDMKKGTRPSLSTLLCFSPSSHIDTSLSPLASDGTSRSSPSTSPAPDSIPPDFVSRVTSLPIVGTALRAYEHGKASSRVVKYGAEMMESSVKNISRPVIHRLPVDVNQLDEFACRQLDRLERYRRASTSDDKMQVDDPVSQCPDIGEPSNFSKVPRDKDNSTSDITYDSTEDRTITPPSQDSNGHSDQYADRQVIPRSRWQTVLLEAGGIGAAVSEESMRRLKYCLQWLQYATAHIDSQMLILRDFIDSLQSYVVDPSASDAYVSPTRMRTLHDVRRDIVNTIRQVVDVVSKYAGGALPEPARARVRGFILHLPRRWASATSASATYCIPEGTPGSSSIAGASAGGTGNNRRGISGRHRKERSVGGPDRSLSATPVSSRAPSPLASSRASKGHPTASAATRAAQHILTLATESLDMVRGVTGVVKESLDRADAWVERLRIIGVQRQQPAPDEPLDLTTSPHRQLPPGLSSSPSTPAQANTPLSIPSTPAAFPSPDGLRMGIHLSEMSARASLSELRLDEDGRDVDGYETPKYGFRPLLEEKRQDMVVDDDG